MDKRRPRVLADVKKSNGVSFRDGGVDGDNNAQFCTRIGCSGRIKYAQNTKIRSYYRSSSSSSNSVMRNAGKSPPDAKLRNAPFKSNLSIDSELAYSTGSLTVSKSVPRGSSLNRNAPVVPSIPFVSRSSELKPLNSNGAARFSQRNLNSSEKKSKKRSADAASSSLSTGAKTVAAAPSVECLPSSSTMTIPSVRNKVGSGHGSSYPSSSFEGKTPMNTSTRMRLASQKNDGHHSSSRNLATGISRSPGNGRVIGQHNISISCRGSQPTTMLPSRNRVTSRFSSSSNGDYLYHHDMNGAAEMLLALERIRQDESLSAEQVLLEMSLFLSGLTVHDQHHDMRLDIDNMSYEELLALEERMGTVSTALSEDELSKSLKISVYQESLPTLHPEGSIDDANDTKCSICQDDYVIGDEIGVLSECGHRFHGACVRQWLRLKNWCPICKASAAAAPSQPTSSL